MEWRPGMTVCHVDFFPNFCVKLAARDGRGGWYGKVEIGEGAGDAVYIPPGEQAKWEQVNWDAFEEAQDEH